MPDPIVFNKQMAEETYDAAASSYDSIWFFKDCGQRLIDLLDVRPGAKVLDVATGTGMVLMPAARRVGPNGHVTGIDISHNMLQQAGRAAMASGLRNTDFLRMDAEHLQFPDASFDVVTCGFGIMFFSPAALSEMYRVCKPAGLIGVTVYDKTVTVDWRLFQIFNALAKEYKVGEFALPRPALLSPEETEALLAGCGFNPRETYRETRERVFANAEEYWDKIILSNWSRVFVTNLDEATRVRFKEDYLKRSMTAMQPDGFHVSFPIIYSIAQK